MRSDLTPGAPITPSSRNNGREASRAYKGERIEECMVRRRGEIGVYGRGERRERREECMDMRGGDGMGDRSDNTVMYHSPSTVFVFYTNI